MKGVISLLVVLLLSGFAVAEIPVDCDGSTVSYWKLDGDATDSFGSNGGSGGYFGIETLMVNTSSKFSGSESIVISDDATLSFSNDFTVEMLVQGTSKNVGVDEVLFEKGNYSIGFDGSENFLASVGMSPFSSGIARNQYKNYHLALVLEGTVLSFYVNGIYRAGSESISADSSGGITIGTNFKGLMDEVAIYNEALSADTLRSHFTKAGAGKDYCSTTGSEAQTNFNIAGCNYSTEGIFADKCSRDKTRFCEDKGSNVYELQNVFDVRGACSFGNTSAPGPGEPQCCPSGWVCDGTSLVCERRTSECSSFDNVDDCNDERCYWLEGADRCVDDPLEYSCGVYTDNSSCILDTYGLGQNGLEAVDRCGTYFNAAGEMWGYHNCSCEWDDTVESCNLGYDVRCFIGEDCGSFRCSKNFEIGSCIDGIQQISWTANAT
ncbi:MAG: LamG domain-containing protein, partial [Anaerolineales bacterium]|nr:LamG domain-containing protein [Anaerolineales bacterium]